QGQTLLTSITVTTDATGNASFTATVPAVPIGFAISATATDPAGNTSEFSQDVTVTDPPVTAAATLAGAKSAALDAVLASPSATAVDETALTVLAAEITHTKSRLSQPVN